MIEDLRLQEDDVATAIGERYDLANVLEAAEAFLRGFVADVLLTCAGTPRAIVRFGHEDERPLDDSGYAALRAFYRRAAERHDVIDANAAVIVGPFRVSLRLLGDDDLFLVEGDDEPVTISGAPWHTLETAPNLVILPAGDTNPLFEHGAHEAIDALVRRHAPAGTDASSVSNLPSLRFPYAVFGAGRGPLRIAMMRVPREDPNVDLDETDPVEP